MKKLSINLDEAVELDIYAKANRTFHCQIDHDRTITGNLTFTARSEFGGTLITMDETSGITVDARRITIYQDALPAPTGVYRYDLIEVNGARVDNLFIGRLLIEPSISQP